MVKYVRRQLLTVMLCFWSKKMQQGRPFSLEKKKNTEEELEMT